MRIRSPSRKRPRSGAAMVEAALVLPIFLTVVLMQLQTSCLGMVTQLVTTAAREGCRVATLQNTTQSDVQTRVDSFLKPQGINIGTVTPSPSTWASAPAGSAITVTLSLPFSQVAWLPTYSYLTSSTVTASATMSSEKF